MATIAVLGAGFVENLLEKRHTVQVWNRSAAKLAPLVAKGTVQAADPAEAARGADRVHLMLAEDGAVEDVLFARRPGLGEGVPVIDQSTILPERVSLPQTVSPALKDEVVNPQDPAVRETKPGTWLPVAVDSGTDNKARAFVYGPPSGRYGVRLTGVSVSSNDASCEDPNSIRVWFSYMHESSQRAPTSELDTVRPEDEDIVGPETTRGDRGLGLVRGL